jgi:hypothetical protein
MLSDALKQKAPAIRHRHRPRESDAARFDANFSITDSVLFKSLS